MFLRAGAYRHELPTKKSAKTYFNVKFLLNRMPFKTMHRALALLEPHVTRRFFPESDHQISSPKQFNIVLFNKVKIRADMHLALLSVFVILTEILFGKVPIG